MKKLPSHADVIIIGGGIIGTSIAYYLSKKGVNNILLEKGSMGEGSTSKCVGGIRTQFSTEINIRFSELSVEVFERFENEFGIDPEFRQIGYLFFTGNRHQWGVLRKSAQLIESMGLDVKLLKTEEIKDRYPFLKTSDLFGGSYSKHDGYAGPYETLQGFIKGARRLGSSLFEGIEVTEIGLEKGRVSSVVTNTGERIFSSVVINAAGPYASHVAAMAGLDLPVVPIRRQVYFTSPYKGLPDVFPMIIDLEHGWYMRREGKGLLLSGPQDSKPSYDVNTDYEGREWTAIQSLNRVPELERADIAGGWAGLYAISPDHHAIIGSFPEVGGFICANGFSGHGFQHSPAVGILMAELVADERTSTLNIQQLRPTRFRENDLIHEHLTAFKQPESKSK
ncbi:NAD(P)/FAD-dependent oxidoreductase [Thermodesulfobacteriota bacterium]